MWLVGLLVVTGVVLVLVLAARTAREAGNGRPVGARHDGDRTGRSRAQQILGERFAAGAITEDEYQERLDQLDGDAGR